MAAPGKAPIRPQREDWTTESTGQATPSLRFVEVSEDSLRWEPRALRRTGVPSIDLYARLRAERKRARSQERQHQRLLALSLIALTLSAVWSLQEAGRTAPRLTDTQRLADRAEQQWVQLQQEQQTLHLWRNRLDFWKTGSVQTRNWSLLVHHVAACIPARLFLERFQVTAGNAREPGRTLFEGVTESMQDLTDFQHQLEQTGIFTHFTLGEVTAEKRQGRKLWRFQLQAHGTGALQFRHEG